MDYDILGTVFTASPAFYHAPRDWVPEPTTSLYLSDYKTINNNTLLPSGTIDNLTLLLKNIGKVKATNIYISSSDSGFLQIMQEKSIPILQPNEGSELQIPVMLKPGYSTSTIIPIRLDLLFETNGQTVKQPLHLIFGTPDIQSNITNDNVAIIEDFKLLGSYPNPVRQSNGKGCTFKIQLNKAASIQIDIYNILGQHIHSINKSISTGLHQIQWEINKDENPPLVNGIYLYKIHYNSQIETGKFLILE